MMDKFQFRNAMSYLTGAVNIITTSGAEGHHGFTASAVCSVTDSPPTLLVCMNSQSALYPYFSQNESLAVNVLRESHEEISSIFANPKIERDSRFAATQWITLKSGAPILEDALVSFDCRIIQTHTLGTHSIFYCEILDIHSKDEKEHHKGLVYYNRKYHTIG